MELLGNFCNITRVVLCHSRRHRVRPLTTTAAWGRVKSTSHGASQTRRTRWMLWSGACHCLLYLTPLTVPNVDQAADPRSPTPVSIPSLLHPPISGALPLRAPAARPTGDQQVRRPRAQLTAASSKVSTPRSSYLLQIGVSCLICLGRNFLPISVFAFGLNTSDCEA